MKRDWRAAREKVDLEGRCRVCRTGGRLEAAHVIPRSLAPGAENQAAANIVPLCPRCHRAYDSHDLDLAPYLVLEEELAAVRSAGSLSLALRRVSNRREV